MKRRLTLCALSTTVTLAAGLLGVSGAAADAAPSTPSAVAVTQVRIGMSSPNRDWDRELASTGAVETRRLFDQLRNPDFALNMARRELAAGRMPILSFKVPGNDWAGAANGRYDRELYALRDRLAALPGKVFVTIHHEPAGDGRPQDYAAMQRHVLPILSPPVNVEAGVIANGFWWSAGRQGLTDAQIAEWLPADVLRKAEVVAADTYQGGNSARPGEDAGVKIRRLSSWATRAGVLRLGVGEYNGLNAPAIRSAGDAILADPRYVFAQVFNSDENNRDGVSWRLTGDRLAAFQDTMARAKAARGTRPSAPATSPAPRDEAHGWLTAGATLASERGLTSENGNFVLAMQGDGNAVVYDYTGRALWNSGTFVAGSSLVVQGDGNVVVYSPDGRPVWSTGTFGRPGAGLVMQDDANLVVYRADGQPVWSTR